MKIALLLLLTACCTIGAKAQTTGGPDAYGYIWYNSDDVQGPTFNWIDITTNGTQVVGLADDNSVPSITMSQPFHYYWSDYTSLNIGSNGWLSFNNVSNIAHCFPTIPTAGGAGDNFLAPFMSDLIFVIGGGEVWYFDDVANDQFVVSYINAPWWSANAPGYVGSNTFQVILSSADSSITFQYLNIDPVNFNNQAGCAADLEIGMENMTGNIGLEVYNEFVPANNHAVRFEYPAVVTFQVIDPAPSWSQNVNNKGSFVSTGQTFSKDIAINNFGNTDVTTGITVVTELLDLALTSVWSSTDIIPSLTAGQSQTINYSNIGPFPAGQYYFRTTTTSSEDINPGNNVLTTDIEVVNVTSNPILMSYATQQVPTGSLGWASGGGVGVYIAPSTYPITVDSVSAYIADGGAAADYYMYVMDNDGPNGMPGTILTTELVSAGSYVLNSWVTTVLSSPVTINSGGFYIGWEAPTPTTVNIGTETSGPISRNSMEYLGSWAVYRENNNTEFLLNAYLTNNCLSLTAIVDTTIDVSCFGSQDGAINITVTGAQGAVNYTWSNGAGTVEDPTNLSAGLYNLTYTDNAGCSNSLSVTVNQPSELFPSGTAMDEVAGNDGSIDLTVSGGTTPYTYLWSNTMTTEDISGLAGGSYSCTVTDANGCTELVTIVVDSQLGLVDLENTFAFNLLPNPTDGEFTISLLNQAATIVEIRLVNNLGQTVLQTDVPNKNAITVNSKQASGVYFVHVRTEQGVAIKRIVIQ